MADHVSLNFVEEIVEDDLKTGKHESIITRFPPEPNGFLHIGHASSLCLNFGLKSRYNGKCNLRFDDTNPSTEETRYVDAIKKDIKWLGFEWDQELYTSDYFDQLFEFAKTLISKGLAYVDDSTAEEIAEQKGTPTRPGRRNKYAERTIEENLDLFERMKAGEFENGAKTLRAKIDMAAPNMLLRDPLIYRIKKEAHHRTGDEWNIYPMYDFAHGQSDSIENITHSVCTLEFENHRPLYNWFIEQLGIFPSRQIEFARRNLSHTVMSKRKLLQLVNDNHVSGWDDPRMPTISGYRRRGYTAASIRNFANEIGIARRENIIDISRLEFSVRQDLNKVSTRAMAVLDPLKLVITNYPKGEMEWVELENNPEDERKTAHRMPFSGELYIEREDFMKDPPKKFFRLGPGRMSRLKAGYIIRCDSFEEDENGEVTQLNCTYFPESKSGQDNSGLKAKGVLHWVSIEQAKTAEIRLYDRLFSDENPLGHEDKDFKEFINPDSLKVIEKAYIEPYLTNAEVGQHFQFLRKGYYTLDPDSTKNHLIFNLTVSLKAPWKGKGK